MRRGDYDYNHTMLSAISTNMLIILVILIIGLACLGGLFIGLTVLS